MNDQSSNLLWKIGAGMVLTYLGYKFLTRNKDPERPPERHPEVVYECNNSFTIRNSNHDRNIRVIENNAELQRSIREINLHCREFGVLGFDCEYAASYGLQPLPLLLQLQTYQGLCVLIRLARLESLSFELKELLENPRILKVGIDAINDSKYLYDSYYIGVKGNLDLRYMAAQSGCEPGTLAKMSEKYLGLKLKKGSDKALHFDWNKPILSEKQIEYAAKDAHAAIELFKFFVDKLFEKRYPFSYSNEKTRFNIVNSEFCMKFVDKYYNGAQGIPYSDFH